MISKRQQVVLFFFDAKMYVVSYCIIVAFHPDLNIPRLYIYRSYDQTQQQLTSTTHFEAIQNNFFADKLNYNKTTYRQLQDAAFAVQNREKNTALSEMFSVELKFTVDCLKSWFDRYHKVLEVKRLDRIIFV